jgi:glutathione S-transferase
MLELLGLPFSPWSEKARWALDVKHVPYRSRTYVPLLGEPLLRAKLRRWTGNVTVPVFTCDDGRVLADSADIARWADQRSEGPRLFPPEHEIAIRRFIDLSERGLASGRALSLLRMLQDRDALAEMVPKALRRPLGPLAVHLGRYGIERTLRKYGALRNESAEHERALTVVLDELRASLAGPGDLPKTLLGGFTFADIAMTQVLAFVMPPAFGLRIGQASRRNFTDAGLCQRYADLVAWRDAIYERHRPRSPH